jgi:hypothetical protein
MRKMLRESNLSEALAEEYVERTAGVAKAKFFTLDHLTEVLSGKSRPQTYAEQKKKEQELLEQRQKI